MQKIRCWLDGRTDRIVNGGVKTQQREQIRHNGCKGCLICLAHGHAQILELLYELVFLGHGLVCHLNTGVGQHALDGLLVLGGDLIPVGGVHAQGERVHKVAGQAQVLAHLVQRRAEQQGQRSLAGLDHTRLQQRVVIGQVEVVGVPFMTVMKPCAAEEGPMRMMWPAQSAAFSILKVLMKWR